MAARKNSLQLAAEVIDGQVRQKTKKDYYSKLNRFTNWIKTNSPDSYSQETKSLIIPFEYLG